MFGLRERQLNFHHGQFSYIYTLTIACLQFTDELDLIISCGIPISLVGESHMAKPFEHPLGLTRPEWKAITDCMWAREVTGDKDKKGNGHFLPAFNRANAHGRMVEKGFMTEVLGKDKGMTPDNPKWRVFKMTDENIHAYNAAMRAVNPDATYAPGEGLIQGA